MPMQLYLHVHVFILLIARAASNGKSMDYRVSKRSCGGRHQVDVSVCASLRTVRKEAQELLRDHQLYVYIYLQFYLIS